jgi:VanZ family protein
MIVSPHESAARVTRVFRAIAWLLAITVVVLSVVPARLRPVTAAPHDIEHALIFLLTGLAFGFAYQHRRALQLVGLTVFAGMVEVAQIWVPTRHARLSDFLVDSVACFVGVGISMVAARYFAVVRST